MLITIIMHQKIFGGQNCIRSLAVYCFIWTGWMIGSLLKYRKVSGHAGQKPGRHSPIYKYNGTSDKCPWSP